jgi:hypothetical protein
MSKIAQMMLPEEVQLDDYQANSPSQLARTDTEYLKPQSINDNSCTFRISNNGILDLSNTKLVLQMTSASTDMSYIGTNGVGALVQRATMKFGNTTICTSDNANSYFALSRSFVAGDTKIYRDHFLYQTNDIFINRLDDSKTSDDGIGYPQNKYSEKQRMNSDKDQVSDGQIPLSLLFPGMSVLDIPLFLLKNHELTIDIVFTPEAGLLGNRAVDVNTTPTFAACPITQDRTMLIVERVYFSSQRMEQIAKSFTEGFSTSYNDVISTRNGLGSFSSGATARETFDIGGAGKTVEGVMIMTPRVESNSANTRSNPRNHAFGRYNSDSFQNRGFNLIINGERALPLDAENVYYSLQASLLGSFIDSDYPQIPKCYYDKLQKEGISDNHLNGDQTDTPYQAETKGLLSYFGMKLDSCRVKGVPIRLDLYRKQETLTGSDSTAAQTGLVTFVLVKRRFKITPSGSVDATYE